MGILRQHAGDEVAVPAADISHASSTTEIVRSQQGRDRAELLRARNFVECFAESGMLFAMFPGGAIEDGFEDRPPRAHTVRQTPPQREIFAADQDRPGTETGHDTALR